jgi:hypothetical protein
MVRIGVFCLVEVELRGLEPLTPCLQIAVTGRVVRRELGCCVSAIDHEIPAVAGINGTLMARSWPPRHLRSHTSCQGVGAAARSQDRPGRLGVTVCTVGDFTAIGERQTDLE